jgi:hypothetical protein
MVHYKFKISKYTIWVRIEKASSTHENTELAKADSRC